MLRLVLVPLEPLALARLHVRDKGVRDMSELSLSPLAALNMQRGRHGFGERLPSSLKPLSAEGSACCTGSSGSSLAAWSKRRGRHGFGGLRPHSLKPPPSEKGSTGRAETSELHIFTA